MIDFRKLNDEKLNERYRQEGWGKITDQALGIDPANVESQARTVAQWVWNQKQERELIMKELIDNLKALLSDIHSMQEQEDPDWFGPFSEFEDLTESVIIEWPNMAISFDKVRTELAKFESSPESGIRMGLGSTFVGQVMDIQNLMKEDRETYLHKLLRSALNDEAGWAKQAIDYLEEFG